MKSKRSFVGICALILCLGGYGHHAIPVPWWTRGLWVISSTTLQDFCSCFLLGLLRLRGHKGAQLRRGKKPWGWDFTGKWNSRVLRQRFTALSSSCGTGTKWALVGISLMLSLSLMWIHPPLCKTQPRKSHGRNLNALCKWEEPPTTLWLSR